jgi:hypothetical protein
MSWTTVGLIGGGINVMAALALVVVVSPGRRRYEDLKVSYEGDNPGLKRFLRHQNWVGAAVLIGTVLQLVAASSVASGGG